MKTGSSRTDHCEHHVRFLATKNTQQCSTVPRSNSQAPFPIVCVYLKIRMEVSIDVFVSETLEKFPYAERRLQDWIGICRGNYHIVDSCLQTA